MVDGWKKKCSVPIIRNVSSDRADSSPSIEREGKKNSPFQANSTMVQKPRHPPWRNVVPLSPFSFHLFSPLAWRLESRGDGEKRKKKKEERKKEETRNLSLPAASFLAASSSLPGSTYHNSSEVQSDIRKVTRRHTSYCSRASKVVAFSNRNQEHLLYYFSLFFCFSVFFFFFYSLRCNACDILFTGRVASRRKRAVAGVKMH